MPTKRTEVLTLIDAVRADVDDLHVALALCQEKLQRAEKTLISAGYKDLGGEVWKPPLGDFNKTIAVFKTQDELVLAKEQLRRLEVYARNRAYFVSVDNLCEHGEEDGCCHR